MADSKSFSSMNPMKAWSDLQLNWMSAVKEMTDKATEMAQTSMNADGLKQFTEAWVDTQNKFIEQGMKMKDVFPSTDMNERFQSASKLYLESYKLWADAIKSATNEGKTEEIKESLKEMWKQAHQMFVDPIAKMPWMTAFPGMPDTRQVTGMPIQAVEAAMEMQKNWADVVERASSAAVEGFSEGGPEVLKEFYASWAKGYELTVGKVIRVPPIGPAREGIELYQKSLDSYLKFCGASFDFYLRTSKPSLDAYVTVSNQANEILKDDVSPETFQKLYSLTIGEFEKRFHELFTTEEFVKTLRTTVEASLSFQKDYQEFLEANLKGTPIVTRTEMDEVHEEMYKLRKQVKELKQTVKSLQKKG